VRFVEKACEKFNLPKKLFEDLQRSELFQQLPHSPIAAALLSSLLSQNEHDLPSSLTELYSKSLDLMLGRWDIKKKASTEKEFQVTERVALLLAEFLVDNRLIWMSETEAQQMINDWLEKRNMDVDPRAVFARLVDRSSIFSRDFENETIGFRHRSFGEYLYARGAMKVGHLPKSVNAFEPYWVYPQFFYIGLRGDCPELLSDLLIKEAKDEIEAWIKVLVMPDYLLAGYQTEYTVVEENIYKIFIEASQLYNRIRKGETKTKLTELPEMHLLWFFQRLIRYSFNYAYFRKAIETTLLRIDAELIDVEIKCFALFFASCFAAELDDSSGFEFLVKNYGVEKLPMPISLAIRIEHEMNKDFSNLPLLKSHEKKLRALIGLKSDGKSNRKASDQDNVSSRGLVGDLFEKPVKLRLKGNKLKGQK